MRLGTLLQSQKLGLPQLQQKRAQSQKLQSKQLLTKDHNERYQLADTKGSSSSKDLINTKKLLGGSVGVLTGRSPTIKFGMERSGGCVPNWFAACYRGGSWTMNKQ